MGLFSFFKFLKANKAQKIELNPNEYVPSFWGDDYCQIEIVPSENSDFIQRQSRQIDELASNSKTDYGLQKRLAEVRCLLQHFQKKSGLTILKKH